MEGTSDDCRQVPGRREGTLTTASPAASSVPSAPGRSTGAVLRWAARHLAPLVIAVVGLGVTGTVTGLSRANYLASEQHMATLETHLVQSGLAVGPVDLERRLGKAVTEVSLTSGSAAAFESLMATSVGRGGPLTVAELFVLTGGAPRLLATVGSTPVMAPSSATTTRITEEAAHVPVLVVDRVLRPGVQRLAYALAATAPGGSPTYVAYGEQAFPASRRVALPPSNPDSDLKLAIYFGKTATPSALIESTSPIPIQGTTARALVPFGDRVLTLVVAPRGSLSGALAPWVAWIILALGLLFTAGATTIAEWLVRRRRSAERTATLTQSLYHRQRETSETLQRALLPPELPAVEGFEIAARYRSGSAGVEVGGDWYDVIAADGRLFFSVGDVSGRGVEAAVVMAQLRHAINAVGFDGGDPGEVLTKVTRMVGFDRHGRFATVLCGSVQLSTGHARLANAGHTPLVLVADGAASVVELPADPPLGIGTSYRSHSLPLKDGAVLLAVTDGLVERHGQSLDDGLERLRQRAQRPLPLEHLLDWILAELVPAGPHDDIAMLAIRRVGA